MDPGAGGPHPPRRTASPTGCTAWSSGPTSSVVVPWQDGRLTLVEQDRYPVGERMWEFPMGMWEQSPGHRPRCARRRRVA